MAWMEWTIVAPFAAWDLPGTLDEAAAVRPIAEQVVLVVLLVVVEQHPSLICLMVLLVWQTVREGALPSRAYWEWEVLKRTVDWRKKAFFPDLLQVA